MEKQMLDQDALYAAFYDEAVPHLDSLYVTALRLTRDPSEAEDLVQEAMLKAFRYFDKYEKGTNCKAWLFKILTNVFINRYNKKRSSKEVLSNDDEGRSLEERVAAPGQNPFVDEILSEQELYHKFFGDEVKRALESLPEEYRLVVLLADLQDFAYKEIAEIMDCPIGTVMSRLFRGRRMLQAALADYAKRQGFGLNAPDESKGKAEKTSKVEDLQEYRRKRKQAG